MFQTRFCDPHISFGHSSLLITQFCSQSPYARHLFFLRHTFQTRFTHTRNSTPLSRLLQRLVSFAEYRLFYRALVQKRHIIWRSLLMVATPWNDFVLHTHETLHHFGVSCYTRNSTPLWRFVSHTCQTPHTTCKQILIQKLGRLVFQTRIVGPLHIIQVVLWGCYDL